MNKFEEQISEITNDVLNSCGIDIIQVNVGLRCNQHCMHCHLEASPDRNEMMQWSTMRQVLEVANEVNCRMMDITGGAPELNPDLRRFIEALYENGHSVQVRTNLTVLLEQGMESLPEFFRAHKIKLVASMPCYLEKNVNAQRGPKVYGKSIVALKRLNALGYGIDPELPLSLVYNPGGPFLPPRQEVLEADYRQNLDERFGIHFTNLITITNMPIGSFQTLLRMQKQEWQYLEMLQKAFNPRTIDNLMCRHQFSVGWDGKLYDCDFNLALGQPIDHGAPDHLDCFEASSLKNRQIVTGMHCFGCTAGCGSSCRGALIGA